MVLSFCSLQNSRGEKLAKTLRTTLLLGKPTTLLINLASSRTLRAKSSLASRSNHFQHQPEKALGGGPTCKLVSPPKLHQPPALRGSTLVTWTEHLETELERATHPPNHQYSTALPSMPITASSQPKITRKNGAATRLVGAPHCNPPFDPLLVALLLLLLLLVLLVLIPRRRARRREEVTQPNCPHTTSVASSPR